MLMMSAILAAVTEAFPLEKGRHSFSLNPKENGRLELNLFLGNLFFAFWMDDENEWQEWLDHAPDRIAEMREVIEMRAMIASASPAAFDNYD